MPMRREVPELKRRNGDDEEAKAFVPRWAELSCGCINRIGGGSKTFAKLWCIKHGWQKVLDIRLTHFREQPPSN